MIVIWVTCALMMAPTNAAVGALAPLETGPEVVCGAPSSDTGGPRVHLAVATDESEPRVGTLPDETPAVAPDGVSRVEERGVRVTIRAEAGEASPALEKDVQLLMSRDAASESDGPKVWIGVRATPVPAPLAAHIGGEGVMIANVAEGSPAAEAGVEQYDVVLQYAGKPIAGPKDLTDVVGASVAGRAVKLDVIRAGQRRQLTITPAERAAAPSALAWKYDEQPAAFLDKDFTLRGLFLNRDDDGKWIIEQLGPLQNVPEMLQHLEKFEFNFEDLPSFNSFHVGPGAVADPDDNVFIWHSRQHDDAGEEVAIEVQREGEPKLRIHRDKDGTISVTREDEEGNEETNTYESLEALEQADPEAADLLSARDNDTATAPVFVRVKPFGKDVEEFRKQYQFIVRERLEDALRRVQDSQEQLPVREQLEDALRRLQDSQEQGAMDHREALDRARAAMEEAQRQYEAARNMDVQVRALDGQRKAEQAQAQAEAAHEKAQQVQRAAAEALGIRVGADGSLTVYRRGTDGHLEKLHFDSAEAFELAEPELYERYEPMLRE